MVFDPLKVFRRRRAAPVTDLTPETPDLNPNDRVYRSANGYVVKVKVVNVPTGDPARLNFVVSGSWCDEETAKALPHAGGPKDRFILSRELAPHSDTPTDDLAGLIEEARQDMVRRVEQAAANEFARRALTGVALP